MTDTTLSNKSMTALGELLRTHRKEMRDELDRLANNIARGSAGSGVGSFGYGVRNTGSDLKAQRVEVEKLIQTLKRNNKALSAYEQYMLSAARKHRQVINDQIAEVERESKARDKNTDAIEDNTDAQEKHTQRVSQAVDTTKRFVKGLVEGTLQLESLRRAVDEFQTSYRLGFKWEPIVDAFQGALMGMDPKAMMEFQAQFRRTSGAMADGIDGFNKLVSANQMEMIQYTGSLHAAAQAMGNMYELSHNMGLRLEDVSGSADGLFTQFKKMQAVTSITVDQFIEMNQRMLSNTDIQGKLLRLNQAQRAQYIQGLNQQQLALQMLGLQKEVAEQLITATEQMSGKKGLERYQDSAKTAIMLQSVLGYDRATATRIAQLKNKPIKTAEESAELQQAMLKITEQIEQRKNSGISIGGVTTHGEIIVDQLLEALGQSEFVDAAKQGALQQSAATNGQALAAHQAELQERQTEWLQQIAKYTSAMSDMLGAWSSTAAAVLAGAVVATLLNRFKAVEWAVGKIFSGAGINPNAPGGPGGPGAPGGGGLKGFLKKHWRGAAGGVAGLGIGVAGNLVAETLLNPDNFAKEHQPGARAAQTAVSWGATGAGLGMMMGPWGAAIGGAGGAVAGYVYETYKYSKDFAAQMETSFAMGTKMLSAEQAKLRAEKEAKEQQLKALIEQGVVTDEQYETVKRIRAELEGINANLKVADVKQSAVGSSIASQFIDKMLKDGTSFGDTGDVADSTNQLQSMLGMAGVKGNVREKLIANMKNAALTDGLTGEAWADLAKVENAIRSGDDVNLPAAWRKYAEQGFATTAQGFKGDIGLQMATIRGEAAATGTLSEAVASQQTAITSAENKVKQLEEELARMENHPLYADPRSGQRAFVAAKERELERAKEALAAQKAAADYLGRSATGEAPLYIRWTDGDMKRITEHFGNEIRKVTGKSPPVASPQGLSLLAAR